MVDPAPDLADDTDINLIRLPTRIRNALAYAGFKTVGEVRTATDRELKALVDIGAQSVKYLRDTLGAPR